MAGVVEGVERRGEMEAYGGAHDENSKGNGNVSGVIDNGVILIRTAAARISGKLSCHPFL